MYELNSQRLCENKTEKLNSQRLCENKTEKLNSQRLCENNFELKISELAPFSTTDMKYGRQFWCF